MNEYLVVACSTALIPKQLAPGSGCAVFRTSPPFHLRVAELQHFKMAENVCSLWVPFVDPGSKDNARSFPLDGCDLKSFSDEALITLFHTAPVIHQLGGVRIVRISKDLVIKGGEDVRASEAATMDYASAMTDVLLPKVHRVVHRGSDKIWGETCLIVMDFIQGSTLHDCWETLNEETRANIVNQIAKYISSLQAVQVAEPPGPIGGRDKFQGVWFSYYGAGPFSTRKALEDWFNLALTISKAWGRCPQDSPPNKFKTLCLVHQDIFPRNLILHPSGQIWLIDWGNAGLYPPAFERGALTWKESEHPDYVSRVLDAIPSHQQELKALCKSSAGLMTAAVMQL